MEYQGWTNQSTDRCREGSIQGPHREESCEESEEESEEEDPTEKEDPTEDRTLEKEDPTLEKEDPKDVISDFSDVISLVTRVLAHPGAFDYARLGKRLGNYYAATSRHQMCNTDVERLQCRASTMSSQVLPSRHNRPRAPRGFRLRCLTAFLELNSTIFSNNTEV